MKRGLSSRRQHGKENPRKTLCGFDPRCLVRGSSRRMKDCEVRRYDKPSNISLITVDKACLRPLTLRFIPIAYGGNHQKRSGELII
jgi:hypothetical protein